MLDCTWNAEKEAKNRKKSDNESWDRIFGLKVSASGNFRFVRGKTFSSSPLPSKTVLDFARKTSSAFEIPQLKHRINCFTVTFQRSHFDIALYKHLTLRGYCLSPVSLLFSWKCFLMIGKYLLWELSAVYEALFGSLWIFRRQVDCFANNLTVFSSLVVCDKEFPWVTWNSRPQTRLTGQRDAQTRDQKSVTHFDVFFLHLHRAREVIQMI